MTQEEKDLLYKDLCARLPYGVKVRVTPVTELKHLTYDAKLFNINTNNIFGVITDDNVKYIPHNVEEVKPYLFPLSSMTEEQKKELEDMGWSFDNFEINNINECLGTYREYVSHSDCFTLIDWCNKNHFDCRGLIPMGLAVDATSLNIY